MAVVNAAAATFFEAAAAAPESRLLLFKASAQFTMGLGTTRPLHCCRKDDDQHLQEDALVPFKYSTNTMLESG